MTGRQVIVVNKGFTLDELADFMNKNWDCESHNQFRRGRPTAASIEEYILLPATDNYMVAVYSRKAGGLFNKENKVILIVCDAPAGIKTQLISSLPTRNIFFGAAKIGVVMSKEKERKVPAENALLFYTEYMKDLLKKDGLC